MTLSDVILEIVGEETSAMEDSMSTPEFWQQAAEQLILQAAMRGFIVTAHTCPNFPLAMGNYHFHVEVRPSAKRRKFEAEAQQPSATATVVHPTPGVVQ